MLMNGCPSRRSCRMVARQDRHPHLMRRHSLLFAHSALPRTARFPCQHILGKPEAGMRTGTVILKGAS